MSSTIAPVLQALSVLHSNDHTGKKKASDWLEDFQRTPEAWDVSNTMLNDSSANPMIQLFAAQTLKQKIIKDLCDLDGAARESLREALLGLITRSTTQKAVLTQLCIALADLAIQMVEWKTVIPDLVARLSGQDRCLIEILKVLAEEIEYNYNDRLPMTTRERDDRVAELLADNVPIVLKLLDSVCHQPNVPVDFLELSLKCLDSWLRTRYVDINLVEELQLIDFAFACLKVEELFDEAVNVVIDIIYETNDVREYQHTIAKICKHLAQQLPRLKQAKSEEDENFRDYCRMYAEASEAYVILLVEHPNEFAFLLEGISECTTYQDLDVVKITFKFWYDLSEILGTQTYQYAVPLFQDAFSALADTMIRHIQHPAELDTNWTSKDREEFKEFRHEMGDTLKDCCVILTSPKFLEKIYTKITTLLSRPEPATWQEIEAPVFSLRVMACNVSDDEDVVMPTVMDLLNKLPNHPKTRYAATLVMSAYAPWTSHHPQTISYQLNFISAGFQNEDVAPASALALRNITKSCAQSPDCKQHLVSFIDQHKDFYIAVSKELPFTDRCNVTEAVARIIAVLPMEEIRRGLEFFCLPIAEELRTILAKPTESMVATDYNTIEELLELIAIFFKYVRPEVQQEGHPCVLFAAELLPLFDECLNKVGNNPGVCDAVNACYIKLINSYTHHFMPQIPSLMGKLVQHFSKKGHRLRGYLNTCTAILTNYATEGTGTLQSCLDLVEFMSGPMFEEIQSHGLENIAVKERKSTPLTEALIGYFCLVKIALKHAPIFLAEKRELVESIFKAGLGCLSQHEFMGYSYGVDIFREMLQIGLHVTPDATRGEATQKQVETLAVLFSVHGADLTKHMVDDLIIDYDDDHAAVCLSRLAELLPDESIKWMNVVIGGLPGQQMSQERIEFLEAWIRAIQEKQWRQLCPTLLNFVDMWRQKHRR